MPEIDPVIFQYRAEINGFLGQLRNTTRTVDQQLGAQEKKMAHLEAQIRRSSGAISAQFRGLAAGIAGAFTGRELGRLVDSFTRFQNQLKVAGLEGEKLAQVQERLFAIGSKYGVSIESLGELYGKSSQAASELGASQEQLLSLTEETSQALLITGTNAAAASGAILGLSQALASGTVRAEEFNQINEGGLRPLLQAAAASERFGGSVAKLRAAVLDGKLNSQDFFRAILAGSAQLEGQAAKATLTLAGAFTALENQLTKYIGTASSSNGVTGALTEAIGALANNLDIVIPALAVIATAIGGRMVAALVAATGASGATSAAVFALQARMIGAATSAEALGFAASTAGRSMLAAFGGPVGIAVTALALGVAYFATRADEAADSAGKLGQATGVVAKYQAELNAVLDKDPSAQTAANNNALANAHRNAAQAAYAHAAAEIAVQRAQGARNLSLAQRGVRVENRGRGGNVEVPLDTFRGRAGSEQSRAVRQAQIQIDQANANQRALDAAHKSALANVPKISGGVRAVAGGKVKSAGEGTGVSAGRAAGPSAAEISARQADELARLNQEELRAKLDLVTNARDRADIASELLAAERNDRIRQIDADKSFTGAHKAAQIAYIKRLYGNPAEVGADASIVAHGPSGLLQQQVARELAQKELDLANDRISSQAATLESLAGIETDNAKRRDLERDALRLQQQIETNLFDQAVANGLIADADQARADLAIRQAAAQKRLSDDQATPLDRYRADLAKASANVNEAFEDIQVKGLQSLNDQLVEAIMGAKSLGSVFKSISNQIIADLLRIAVQRAIIEPLANAIGGGGGGGGGLFGGLSKLLGFAGGIGGGTPSGGGGGLRLTGARASGGPVSAGGAYLVGERGPEVLRLGSQGGFVMPNTSLNAARGGGASVIQHFHLDARGAVLTQDIIAQINLMGQQAAVAGARGGHELSRRDIVSLQRPRV